MATQDPIFGPLLQKSEAFQQQLATAISAASSRNKELESQYQSKIATLERELEESSIEIERLKASSTSLDQDAPSKGSFLPSTPAPKPPRTIDGVEYVTKDEYNKLFKSLQHTGKKYHMAQQKLDHLEVATGANKGKGTPQCQPLKQLSDELEMEKAKVKEFERKLGTLTQLLDVTQTAIQSVIETNKEAMKRYKKYRDEDDRWKAEMLEKGAITASDFEQRPSRDPWPSIAAPLRHLFTSISGNNIMRTRGQSVVPPRSTASKSTPCPPAKHPLRLIKGERQSPAPLSPTQDPDVTSDEEPERLEELEGLEDEEDEPESALLKFSPTSRAIMRKPGSETLAVLHPEPLSPIESHLAGINWEIAEDALVSVKSEPMSEPDWYSKYGYSRIISGEQETFDLDNITAPRRESTDRRSFGQLISTPDKDRIRSPFLMQSSQLTRSSSTTRGDQPADSHFKPSQHDPIVINDTSDEDPLPLQVPVDKATPQPSSKSNAVEVPSKPKPPSEKAARSPLGEIPDPNNGPPEPSTGNITSRQPANRKKNLTNAAEDEGNSNKENPPAVGKLTDMLSTPTQNNRLPPMVARSTGALKLKRRSLGSMSTTRQPMKRSSLNFPSHSEATGVVETTNAVATPGEKRLPEGPQGSSHKKKRRTEGSSTTPAPEQKPDDPFSPSKYRINKNKNDGLGFAFGEVVRDKARKDCLPKCVKECCRDLASGKLHDMWEPPVAYQAPKFSSVDSSPPGEVGEASKNLQYKEWNEAREKSERNLGFGKHRAQHQKAAEVMGYWESDFPTTQQLEEQRKESDRRYMEKGFERYEQANKGGMYERRV
ncbi:hypothetical protein TWF730_006916 [Orbilia blumenaviensis]|uniref:DNA endonuclease activator Ctp1 C-terminal domain-containing protein n=1 Tax=Orbilia blumenaviensis TaxID=1796055 RepID=A0AAV9VI91_9PEZI